MTERPRVVVLFGGRSSEHKISCLSAGSVLAQLDPARYDVVPVGITPDGAWVLGPTDPAELRLQGRELPEVTSGRPVALPADPTRRELIALDDGSSLGRVDVVLPVLHGPGGEDGTVQGLLESAGVPYVGAGVLSSAASMDKDITKRLLRDAGLAVGDVVVLTRDRDTLTDDERARLGLPVFVKPARAGSSVGITRVADWADLDTAIATARAEDPKVLVEAAIVGREIECGVLEHPDGRVEASVPAEIRVVGGDAGWYDFDTKYLDDACELDVPAKLDDDVAEAVRATAVAVFQAMDVEGLARVDFFLTADGSLVVNELNTVPGFTATSLYPRMWATAGVDYPTLLTTLVETALARRSHLSG
ncbi:D-alanine-D-alanine ligase [Actinomycetospora succinea]|uniref:D-alanine--D-alanine ligase n=1 Tax=Actinomycetospora succinea TaxID=663603 RepID=A0A4R6VSC5_9PSEU|nr:D-alanine--D-alanine ligase family protein [Actinomycetospora succinea]TDQ65517.1 D-alanine-D-alanine ligase [Actinomycetospora succinea]